MHITKLAYIPRDLNDDFFDKLNNAEIDYAVRELVNDGDEVEVEGHIKMFDILLDCKVIVDTEYKDLVNNQVETIFFYGAS